MILNTLYEYIVGCIFWIFCVFELDDQNYKYKNLTFITIICERFCEFQMVECAKRKHYKKRMSKENFGLYNT